MQLQTTLRCLVAAAAWCGCHAFYLPGFSPIEYQQGSPVDLKVNKLTSAKTQLPYSYYTLPYCRPQVIQATNENLGETLTGEIIENSPYVIEVLRNTSCKVLCSVELTQERKDKFRSMIEDEYMINWMVDNLPAATRYNAGSPNSYTIRDGFLVGYLNYGARYHIFNHVDLGLQFHTNPQKFEGYRIVGFEVQPRSVAHNNEAKACSTLPLTGPPLDIDKHGHAVFTYTITWTESPVRWASRWDVYLRMTEKSEIHWFAILNSLMIVLFLSAMVATILLRTLHRDIMQYNEVSTAEEAGEETGWKLVHGDVFRKPKFFSLLAVSVGSGVQILGMALVTLLFAPLGLLSPAHRGSLLQSMMLVFTLMGLVAGYVTSRFIRIFDCDGSRWKWHILRLAFLYPGFFFFLFFVLNLLIWGQKSSGAVPFATMFALLVLWFGVSVPLVFLGAYSGFRKPAVELPTRTNPVPRAIPQQPWFVSSVMTCLVGGLLPFGSVLTELFFLMSSLWLHQFYYLFGFLGLVLLIVVITCAEVSISLTYYQLTSEDHHWWWRSFLSSGSAGLYMFLYSIMYFWGRLQIEKTVSTLLYFGYMLILSTMFFLLTGSIGTCSSFLFVRAIYSSIKID